MLPLQEGQHKCRHYRADGVNAAATQGRRVKEPRGYGERRVPLRVAGQEDASKTVARRRTDAFIILLNLYQQG